MMKHFLSVSDVPDISKLIAKAKAFKGSPSKDSILGAGTRIGLIFLNPSLRTRISTQLAARNLGIEPIVFDIGQNGWQLELEDGAVMNGSSVEHIRDAAPVLGSYFDIIGIRSFPTLSNRDADNEERLLHQLVKYADVPIVNLESATLHPLQSLADLLSISEHWNFERKPKIVLTWAPHIKPLPQCVANSFSQWVNAWNKAEFVIAHPPGYALDRRFTEGATIVEVQEEALRDADFVYVKNWSAYEDYGAMPTVNGDWCLTPDKLLQTRNARVMHCLPVRRNVELSDAILDGSSSLITEQAANRVWATQAVLHEILQNLTD
ncbi:MAG: acetylornithine carbamoyltransferase [Chitinophagaceae bacterium]